MTFQINVRTLTLRLRLAVRVCLFRCQLLAAVSGQVGYFIRVELLLTKRVLGATLMWYHLKSAAHFLQRCFFNAVYLDYRYNSHGLGLLLA